MLLDAKGKPFTLSHHNNIEHSIGEEIPSPTLILPSAVAGALGSSAIPAREDHVHGLDMNTISPIVGYTPATNGFTSFSSFTAYYQIIGKRCFVSFQAVTPVFNGATTGIGLPTGFAPVNTLEIDSQRSALYFDATGGRSYGSLFYWLSGSIHYVGLLVDNVAATYVVGGLVTATVPFTWTTNDYFNFSINYRIA